MRPERYSSRVPMRAPKAIAITSILTTAVIIAVVEGPISLDVSARLKLMVGTPDQIERKVADLPTQYGPQVAFPGAVGWGAEASFGRKWRMGALSQKVARAGLFPVIAATVQFNDVCDRTNGEILFVTNTDNSGSGSLRDVLASVNDNVMSFIIFRTGGSVTLSSDISVTEDCLYVAGQTAPGGGFQLYHNNSTVLTFETADTPTHNIWRYLRLRADNGASSRDVVSVLEGTKLIFDHLSVQFGTDEVFSLATISTATRSSAGSIISVTLMRSIVGPGLRPHSTGSLIGGTNDRTTSVDSTTIAYNLFVNNSHRNPVYQDTAVAQGFINNVVYNCRNWMSGAANEITETNWGPLIDYSRNYYKAGPWAPSCWRTVHRQNGNSGQGRQPARMWVNKNVVDSLGTVVRDSTDDIKDLFIWSEDDVQLPDSAFVGSRQYNPTVAPTEVTAAAAYASIVTNGNVGAWRRLDCDGSWIDNRDALDSLLVFQAANNTGPSDDTENDESADYGGIPSIASGTACTDSDSDGMPDEWEDAKEFDKNDSSDALQDRDGDGYTNLEEYLNGSTP